MISITESRVLGVGRWWYKDQKSSCRSKGVRVWDRFPGEDTLERNATIIFSSKFPYGIRATWAEVMSLLFLTNNMTSVSRVITENEPVSIRLYCGPVALIHVLFYSSRWFRFQMVHIFLQWTQGNTLVQILGDGFPGTLLKLLDYFFH